MEMLRYLARTIRMLSDQVDNMTFLQADRRIARLLTAMAEESGICIRCTHEEIGNRVGVSRVTVSKILSQFSRQGWIKPAYGSPDRLRSPCLEGFRLSGSHIGNQRPA